MTSVEIIQARNGFVVSYTEYMVDGDPRECVEVFEQKDNEHGVIEAGEDLLWFIIDHFGLGGSRYDEKRLRVGFEKGDKYEEKENEWLHIEPKIKQE